MILGDTDLHREQARYQLIDPFEPANVQPASVDLTLDTSFARIANKEFDYQGNQQTIDLGDVQGTLDTVQWTAEEHQLLPQNFVLGSTSERISVPSHMVGIIEGKSSLARLGLLVHITAGFIDPGFQGKITLEFFNCSHIPIILRAGLKICQVSFTALMNPAKKPYGHTDLSSKYQHQIEATGSKYAG